MDLNNIFSASELLGVLWKQQIKTAFREHGKTMEKDVRVAYYKVVREVMDELIEEETKEVK